MIMDVLQFCERLLCSLLPGNLNRSQDHSSVSSDTFFSKNKKYCWVSHAVKIISNYFVCVFIGLPSSNASFLTASRSFCYVELTCTVQVAARSKDVELTPKLSPVSQITRFTKITYIS